MNHRFLLTCLALIFTTLPVFAQSQFERELSQLQEQQAKALAAAAEPVNRRYQSDLESLLHRATQANDLQTANKINDELKKLGTNNQTSIDTTGVTIAAFTNRLIGTKWVWFGGETLTFLADGKAQWKQNPVMWPWKVTSAGHRIVEGENVAKGKKFTMTFDRDLKNATIEGDGGMRKSQNLLP